MGNSNLIKSYQLFSIINKKYLTMWVRAAVLNSCTSPLTSVYCLYDAVHHFVPSGKQTNL